MSYLVVDKSKLAIVFCGKTIADAETARQRMENPTALSIIDGSQRASWLTFSNAELTALYNSFAEVKEKLTTEKNYDELIELCVGRAKTHYAATIVTTTTTTTTNKGSTNMNTDAITATTTMKPAAHPAAAAATAVNRAPKSAKKAAAKPAAKIAKEAAVKSAKKVAPKTGKSTPKKAAPAKAPTKAATAPKSQKVATPAKRPRVAVTAPDGAPTSLPANTARTYQNKVLNHLKPGGKCRAMWDLFDAMRKETGHPPLLATAEARYAKMAPDMNPRSFAVMYNNWRRFHQHPKQSAIAALIAAKAERQRKRQAK